MTLIHLAEIGTFTTSLLLFVHAINTSETKLILFLVLDAFIFELVVIHLFPTLSYSSDYFLIFYNIPLMIACGWANLLYCFLTIFKPVSNILLKSVIIATLMTTIDLVVDKVAVSQNFWQWSVNLNYFGIPYNNFFGWFSYSFLICLVLSYFVKKETIKEYFFAFLAVSALGLISGSIWFYLLGPYQTLLWWLLYASAAFFLLLRRNEMSFTKPLYLILVPASFMLAALGMIFSNIEIYQSSFIYLSVLFSASFIAFLSLHYWKTKGL